jgi:hypothetical protein
MKDIMIKVTDRYGKFRIFDGKDNCDREGSEESPAADETLSEWILRNQPKPHELLPEE